METVRASKHMANRRQEQTETEGNDRNIFEQWEQNMGQRREKVSMTERKRERGASQQTRYAHSLTRQTEWERERGRGRERERAGEQATIIRSWLHTGTHHPWNTESGSGETGMHWDEKTEENKDIPAICWSSSLICHPLSLFLFLRRTSSEHPVKTHTYRDISITILYIYQYTVCLFS